MKKSIILTAVSLVGLAFASCDDFLNDNRYPLSQQTNNPAYWDNEANVAKQCEDLYRNFTGYGDSGYGLFYFQTLTDNQGSGVGGAFTNWSFTNIPTSSSLWRASYEVIRHCNEIIIKTGTSKLADKVKAKYIGIARMNRAMQYYELVRGFGDVPYVNQVLDTNSPELMGARTDRDVVMDSVYADLDYATKNIGSGSKSTWSSDMAYAMMSKICLYEGTYCKYRTVEENYKAADLQRANRYLNYVVAAGDVLMGKGYSLNSDYRSNYNSVSLEGNPEMIYYKAYKEATLTHQTIRYTVASTVIAGVSKDAFDDFLFKDGKPKALTSLSTDDAGVVKQGVIDGKSGMGQVLSITNVLATRDDRLSAIVDTVVCYGSSETGMTYSRAGSSQLSSSTGYLVRKFDNTSIPVNFRTGNNYTCAPVFWLSVIYCDYAEAKAELGTLSDADLNNTINKLYKRAGLPTQTVASLSTMNDPANDMNVSSLLWEVRRCRRCETLLDDDLRYWDLQRWHQLDKLDTQKNPDIRLGANLKNAVKPWNYMSGDYMMAIPNNERVFSKREYLYPIPSQQITLNPALTQNANWAN
ncbi:MAG: RagB/SusD family nutrient uptake outer membrane protein [Muribaculaceae bacterium]|nr:RagB/SusD family nutrient uptake outer membrane protein [Muribaculaceae bacterium]